MKIFVCGRHNPALIENALDDLDDKFEISEICGSASSPCMDTIVPWAEDMKVPITLYLPEDYSVEGMICLNTSILDKEKPNLVLIYKDHEVVTEHLIQEANENPFVNFIIREI